MANWYVATTGNDSTGNGSSGNPWKTLDKTVTQNASLARGDFVYLSDGTYAENSGSAGYWSITRLPSGSAGVVTITPLNGATGNVTITGTAGTGSYDVLFSANTQNYTFQYLKFQSANSSKLSIIRINAMTNVIFNTCTLTVVTNSGQINFAISGNPGVGSPISGLTINNCTVAMSGSDNARAISFVPSAQVVDTITISNCPSITATGMCVVMTGVTNVLVYGNTINSTSAAYGGYGVWIGFDSYLSTLNSSAITQNNNITSASGHTVLYGSGISTGRISGNTIYGGNSSSSGQGCVLKNCSGVYVIGNTIYDGYNSGLYFKAATGNFAYHNVLINRYSAATTACCIRLGINSENNSKASGNIVRYNKCIIQTLQAFYWEGSSGDDGTNLCDYNEFYFTPNSGTTWGTVTGTSTSGQAIAGLQASWAGSFASAEQANDAHSNLWGSMLNIVAGATPSKQVYAIVIDQYGQLYNGVSFEPQLDLTVNLGRYVMPFSEAITGNGIYRSLVSYGLSAGSYTVLIGQAVGSVAAITDPQVSIRITLDWSGATPITNASLNSRLNYLVVQ